MKDSKFSASNFSQASQEFKHYSSDLPIGPLEEESTDNDNCMQCVISKENCTDNNELVNIQPLCRCIEPVNLNPILIPVKELPLMEAASQRSDIVHTKGCSEHVQNARAERDDALRLAKFYRTRVEDLVKEKRDLRYSLESQVDRVRTFRRNQITEGESRAGRMVQASLLQNYTSTV